MANRKGPVYESTFLVDAERAAEFESWLRRFVETSLPQDGIDAVHQRDASADEDGSVRIILQFDCRDDAIFDELRDSYFADIDVAIVGAFGESASVTGRCLREDHSQDKISTDNPDCLNCGARLSGQYCGLCGQRAATRLISIWQLLAEAFGDLFELDSRLWRTLVPLLIRPGQLTRDYLLGRRARYMPPFRMYLVLSLIFFVVAFFNPREELGLLFEPEPVPTAAEEGAAQQAREEFLEGFIDGASGEEDVVADQVDESGVEPDGTADDTRDSVRVAVGTGDEQCNIDSESLADWPDWFKRRLTPERLEVVCDRIVADDGATFLDLLVDNIPVALIVLLPLMALVLKILYPLSRRYFVEHLLFIVHFHAFFFLILTLQILFSRLVNAVGLAGTLSTLVIVAASLYIPVYLYMAMRRVYDQRHILTIIKYFALVVAYWLGASLTMLGAVLFAVLAVSTGTGGTQ
jgi:hypothetical protein